MSEHFGMKYSIYTTSVYEVFLLDKQIISGSTIVSIISVAHKGNMSNTRPGEINVPEEPQGRERT